MQTPKPSQKKPRRVPLLFVLCVMFVLIMVTGMWLDAQKRSIDQLKVTIRDAAISSELLKRESESLNDELNQSQSKEYIIATARQRYHYIMPNELIFVVKNPEALGDPSADAEVTLLEDTQP